MPPRSPVGRPGQALEVSSASLGGFCVVAIAFFVVLTVGYLNYARLIWPGASPPVQWLGAFAVAFGAFLLARATASARLDEREPGAHPGLRHTWVLFFVLLLAMSALGTMNALFYFFEGEEVIDQRLEQVRAQLTKLKARGRQALQVEPVERLRASVETRLGDLEQRITKGGGGSTCGVGPDAREVIAEIAKDLPGFGVIPRTQQQHDCRHAAELREYMQAYRDTAMRMLSASSIFKTHRAGERDAAVARLDKELDEVVVSLDAAAAAVRDPGTSRRIARDYMPAQTALKQAASTYQVLLALVEITSGETLYFDDARRNPAPRALDIEDVTQLGNVAHIVKNVVKRMDRGQTYVYLVAAFLLDAFMVWAFMIVMTQHRAHAVRQDSFIDTGDSEVQVHYLWTYGHP